MSDNWTRFRRLLRGLGTKRGIILALVIGVSVLGAGLAILEEEPANDSATGNGAETTEAPDGGPAETSTVETEKTESAPSKGTGDDGEKSDRETSPQTQGSGVTEETTQTTSKSTRTKSETTRTTSEVTETTTTTTTNDDGPDASVSGESNPSVSSLTRPAV